MSKIVKCKANSIYFLLHTMQCNEAVDSTSSKNYVSDTSKFKSLPILLRNIDNKDKSLSDIPSKFFFELIVKCKRDVSTYKNLFFKAQLMQRSMK